MCWLSGDRAGSRRYCQRRRGNGQLFQWVQDLSSLFWSEEEIDARLDTIMRHAIESVWQKAQALAIPCVPPPGPWPANGSYRQVKTAGCIPEAWR